MLLSRRATATGAGWFLNDRPLPESMNLSQLLTLSQERMRETLSGVKTAARDASGALQPPVDAQQEIWGSGVTYLRSRDARQAESASADVYAAVYEAERPEIFFKSQGWRARGHGEEVRIRADTTWNVPEPELTLVINAQGEIVGYTVGNDMSSRDIEGANPLYLPQAKTYNGSCAVGPAIHLCAADELDSLSITMEIVRDGDVAFQGETSTSNMKRTFPELAHYLYRELDFPQGALLMTGTGIVPPDEFTLRAGDRIAITVGALTLENRVA